jgi:glycosyltransferase involved in cell wall biosynthesis
MRILQVCDHYPPDSGGLATHVQRLSRHLLSRGHEVRVVVAGAEGSDPGTDGLEAVRVGSSFSRLPGVYEAGSPPFHPPWPDGGFRSGLEAVAEAFDPDVVHAHGWCAFSVAASSGAWSRSLICTLHDHGLACPKKSLLRFDSECGPGRGAACLRCDGLGLPKRTGLALALERSVPRLRQRASLMLAVSSHVSHRVAGAGVEPRLLRVVPNFVDLPAASDSPAEQPQSPPGGGPASILFVGPAAPHKGRQVLIEAFRGLRSREVELKLAGGDGTLIEPGVSDLGRQDEAGLAELYRNALFLVVPSVWPDPCPTVALEAMAHGRPVIASATGGLTDIVEDGVTGLLVEPKSSAALIRAIESLLDDGELRQRLGQAARQAVERFSSDVVVAELEGIYAEVAGSGRERR